MTTKLRAGAVVIMVTALGCGSGSHGFESAAGICVVATSCPDAGVPSYRRDVTPILENACIGCHRPSGAAGKSETTYLDVYDQREPMLFQVAGCSMPPVSGPGGASVQQLTPQERVTLTSWLECGAPDN